ncbi:cytochrome P450 [Streptomyces sp. NBC_00555]|uniref:cytochrome P450 n=1 Tax=Streptomyces sp. NBC_00555 TaxID=2903662 RepID=UPI00225652DD|nr:cytochrome P450 [Streptomyces sp. NBC_00555]MCX5016021.1 cytochrome P450 [Streptomyces sp. NBC_00555]
MTSAPTTVPDLTDPLTHLPPDGLDEVWAHLRREDPVHWHPGGTDTPGFWVLTRHADVSAVLRDSTRFTSERGNVLATMLHGGDSGAGSMLAVTDGPHHTALRNLLLKAFSPRALEGVVRQVRRTSRRLVTEALERGGCDFAQDIASYVPLATICDLLAVPESDREYILTLTKSALASDYANLQDGEDRLARAELLMYFHDLVRHRRAHPGSDAISLMATEPAGSTLLDDDAVVLNCYSLIMGGDETSRLSMIGAVRTLAHDAQQWQALSDGTAPLKEATEEVLRWTTPTLHFGRAATEDVELHGRTIAKGDLVTLWLSAANRDERVFTDPHRFDLARTPNKHLSLGYGPHFCLGAYLGRVEITAMLDALRTFVGSIEQTGDEQRIYSNFLAGMSSLPVSLSPRPGPLPAWQE